MVFLPDELAVYEGDPIRFHITARNLPAAFEPTLKILDEQGRDISANVEMPKIVRDAEDHATVVIEWTAPYAVRHTSHKIAVLVSQPPLQKRLWIQIDDRNRPPRARADVNGKVAITEGDAPKVIDLIGLDPDEDVVEFELIKVDEGIDVDLTDDKLVVTVPDRPGDQSGTDRIVTLRAVDDTDGETTFRVPIQIVDVDHAPRIAFDVGKSPFVVIRPTRDGGTTVLRGAAKPGLNALLSIKDPDRPDVVFTLDFPKGERPRGMAIKPAEAGQSRLTWRSQGRDGWGPRTFVMVASAEGEPSRSLPVRLQIMRRIEPAPATSSDPIDRAFDWLRRHQLPDGSFPISGRDFARFSEDEDAWGTGREEHRVGVAALAVIAALRAGDASPWVSTAVRHIVSAQDSEGRVTNRGQRWMYSQVLATEALVLAWHLLGDSKLRLPANKAVKFLLDARQPESLGGWRYDIRDSESDTSMTAWAVRALLTARMAGLQVEDEALRGGLAFIESMTADDGRIGYQEVGGRPGRPSSRAQKYLPKLSESLTAGGLSVLLHSATVNAADPRVKAAVRLILSCPPAWSFSPRPGATLLQKLTYEEKRRRNNYSTKDFYYWQHATFLFRTWRIVRGKTVHKNSDWKGMTTFATAQQKKAGDARGSWDPDDAWGEDGGRSYATAMVALAIVNSVFDDPLVGER